MNKKKRNNILALILAVSFLVLIGFAISNIFFLVIKYFFAPAPTCNALGDFCSNNGNCCGVYPTDHGTFYGYCSNICRVADGLDFNLNALQWCGLHAIDPYYREGGNPEGKNYVDWNLGTSCNDLFYGFNEDNGFGTDLSGLYDYRNNQVKIYGGGQSERFYFDDLGSGIQYASDSDVSGLTKTFTDTAGRFLQGIDANGNMIRNFYDSHDRLIKNEYFLGGGKDFLSYAPCWVVFEVNYFFKYKCAFLVFNLI